MDVVGCVSEVLALMTVVGLGGRSLGERNRIFRRSRKDERVRLVSRKNASKGDAVSYGTEIALAVGRLSLHSSNQSDNSFTTTIYCSFPALPKLKFPTQASQA